MSLKSFHKSSIFIFTLPFPLLSIADVSTTMIIKPGPVIDFLIANQNVNNPYEIDWSKVGCLACQMFVLCLYKL